MKTIIKFVIPILLLLVATQCLAQFGNTNGTKFPYTNGVSRNDVFIIGTPGVTNKNIASSNILNALAAVSVPTFNLIGNASGSTNNYGTNMAATLWVSFGAGDDSTAMRGNSALPWKSIATATAAAVYGDQVHVLPGFYTNTVVLRDGISLYFDQGATLYNPAGAYALVATGATNVVILGSGFFPGAASGSSASIMAISNVLCDVYWEADKIGRDATGTTDQIVSRGSYQSMDVRPRWGGLTTINANNTNVSSIFNWYDAPFRFFYQHLQEVNTNRFFDTTFSAKNYEENSVGFLELYGGSFWDDDDAIDLHGGYVTFLGTHILDVGPTAFLDATRYTNYSIAPTNIHGYYFKSNMLTAENAFKVNNQGAA